MDIRKADKSDIQEILRLIEDSYTPYRDSIKDIDDRRKANRFSGLHERQHPQHHDKGLQECAQQSS